MSSRCRCRQTQEAMRISRVTGKLDHRCLEFAIRHQQPKYLRASLAGGTVAGVGWWGSVQRPAVARDSGRPAGIGQLSPHTSSDPSACNSLARFRPESSSSSTKRSARPGRRCCTTASLPLVQSCCSWLNHLMLMLLTRICTKRFTSPCAHPCQPVAMSMLVLASGRSESTRAAASERTLTVIDIQEEVGIEGGWRRQCGVDGVVTTAQRGRGICATAPF